MSMTTLPVSLTMTSEQNGGTHLTKANTKVNTKVNTNSQIYSNGQVSNRSRNGHLNNSKVKFISRNMDEQDMGIEFHV